MHISFKIVKFYFTLRCSTCFGHHCVHHQELPSTAHAASGHRVVYVSVAPSSPVLLLLNNRTGLEDATELTTHGDQRLHVQ
jgi:hypothetical protein